MNRAFAISVLLLASLRTIVLAQDQPGNYDSIGAEHSQLFVQPASTTRQMGVPEPIAVNPPAADSAAPARSFLEKLEFHPHGEATQLLKFGNQGFGITDLEGQLAMAIPFCEGIAPLKIVPGAAIRMWDGSSRPTGIAAPNLPARVYDFYTDIGWRPRPAKWFFIDLKVTPGFYFDLNNTGHGAFRPRGQGLAIFALSERFQIVAGVVYTNRVLTKIVPAGGIRWAPNEDTEFRLVFPAPRISHRICNWREAKIKLYLSGEFGGGAWAIRREDGRDDVVDYSDIRLLTGVEAELPGNRRCYSEVGYVFNRRIDYASGVPGTFRPSDTVLFRGGFTF